MSACVGDYLMCSLLYVDGCLSLSLLNADLKHSMFILTSNKDIIRVDNNYTCSEW